MRAKWERRLAEVGVAALHAELARVDAAAPSSILPTDGRRIVRALEVVELTGQPFAASAPIDRRAALGHRDRRDWIGTQRFSTSAWRSAPTRCSPAGWSTRSRRCWAVGLRDGVTASRALGYAQVIDDLDSGGDGSAARDPTFIGTRRYVRRQRSWFRRDHRISWLDGAAPATSSDTLRIWRHVS